MELASGTVIERYTVQSVLGSGGMATVFLVRHNQLGSLHAMKALTIPTPDIRKRLLQEGRLQSNLRHPNVVAVTDAVEIDGMPALVMEYVRGPSLADWLETTRPSLAQADDLARGILEGVAAAHRAGLVHRDLKPANILLAVEGGKPVPKIIDFGLAKVLDGGDARASMHRTRSGVAMGTPAYMAPEQVRDSSAVDHRADLFSLGAVLYELVSGRRAFGGRDTMELFQAVCSGRHVPLDELVPRVPARMVEAVEAALEVDVEARVQDCDALLTLWTGRKGPWEGDHPAWDQRALFQVASLGPRGTDRQGLDARLPPTDERTFVFEAARPPSRVEIAGCAFEVRETAPRTVSVSGERQVTLTRGLLVATSTVDGTLWKAVAGGGEPRGVAWEEAVAYCNRLSEAAALVPAYALSQPRLRKPLSIDDMGRMLYDLLPFDRIPLVLRQFGADTLAVVQHAPGRLAEVEGIGPKTAARVARQWDPWRYYGVDVALDLDATGWRLPTEAEWEAAAPADPSVPWEWVFDLDPGPGWVSAPEPLPAGQFVDPRGAATGTRRVQRGAAGRRAVVPWQRDPAVGFRVVRRNA